MNPLLWKEIKVGTRERRVFVFHVLFLLFVSVVALWRLFSVDMRGDYSDFAEEGQALHAILVLVMAGMLLLITPAMTAGALSSEREGMSLDLLLSSGATPAQIVGGKSAYAVAFMGLLLLSAMPLDSLALFLGGVSPLGFLGTYAMLGALALVLAEMGLFVSAREKRTTYATTQAYGLVGLALLGLYLLAGSLEASLKLLLEFLPESPAAAGVLLFNLLCLAAFLRFKSRNHLAVRLANLRAMGALFALWYLADCAALGVWMAETQAGFHDGPWGLQLVVGLVLLGCFLNAPVLEIPAEARRYRRSLLASPYLWAIFLAGGTALAGALADPSGLGPLPVGVRAGQVLLYGLALVALARAVGAASGPKVPGAVAYFTVAALIFAAPSMGLLASLEDRTATEWWHFVWLSPYLSSQTLLQPDFLGVPMSVRLGGDALPVPVASALGLPLVVGAAGLLALALRRLARGSSRPAGPTG